MEWSFIKRKLLYDGFFKLSEIQLKHELFSGDESPELCRELIDRGNAVAVLPYDPARDELVLIEQFRIGVAASGADPWTLEVIAGFKEKGETPEQVIHREAQEEAGCKLESIELMYQCYTSPGGCSEQLHLYVARTDTTNIGGVHGLEQEGEDIRVHVVSSQQAFQWLDTGRINSVMPIIALQWLQLNQKRLRQQWL